MTGNKDIFRKYLAYNIFDNLKQVIFFWCVHWECMGLGCEFVTGVKTHLASWMERGESRKSWVGTNGCTSIVCSQPPVVLAISARYWFLYLNFLDNNVLYNIYLRSFGWNCLGVVFQLNQSSESFITHCSPIGLEKLIFIVARKRYPIHTKKYYICDVYLLFCQSLKKINE